jgi:maltooligosyltrehalose trehalohydrolase
VLEDRDYPLTAEPDGYFSGLLAGARPGARYKFRLDDEPDAWPDPASRWQPDGPHGESVVIDPATYRWRASNRTDLERRGLVISEIHIGTFTPEGTFAAAIDKLPLVAETGVNTLEIMPLHEFPGLFGWGYDGVDLWAPTRLYGTPDDFRRFVDAAHEHDLAVILDVVYNHLGPDGAYLKKFTSSYYTDRYVNDWGEAINFDGDESAGVREFFCENAAYWIDEFHLDGLRLDATQSLHDSGERHIIADITASARAAAPGRQLVIVAENEPQDADLVEKFGVDALWNDDWHHSARVALTGRREAYYTDYYGRPQEFLSMVRFGFLYQGQRYSWQKERRGTPSLALDATNFVCYLEDHDQIANSASGERLRQITDPAKLRAMTALLLLAPQTPMIFQGDEFGATSPFFYFADHSGELGEAVRNGRREFLAQFPSLATTQQEPPVPNAPSTFERCKLDWSERDRHSAVRALYRDLLTLRKSDPAFSRQDRNMLAGAVLSDDAFLLRWLNGTPDERLLIVNLGSDLVLIQPNEPLLAPPRSSRWELLWSSEGPEYGGSGNAEVETADGQWQFAGHSTVVLKQVVSR